MPIKIYMDESGFTGTDLYNPSQRFFAIGSTVIGNEEAKDILKKCFPRYQGDEYKFTNIWNRERSRHGLRALAAEIPQISDRAFVWVIDKRFCLLTKMIDYLVEPGAYEAGYDWYANGWGMRYMNTIHRDLTNFGSDRLYDTTVKSWDSFARKPSVETFAEMERFAIEVKNSTQPPLSSLFAMILKGIEHFRARNSNLSDFQDTNEIQVTSIFSTLAWWRQHRKEDFDLVHDESSAFTKQRELWETMLRDDFESPPLKIANGAEVELPIRVRSTTAVRSHESHSVQLCDILAGLLAKAGPGLIGGQHDPFIAELVQAGAGELSYSGVMPHQLYIDGLPQARDGPDMVDRMVELIRPYIDKKSK